MDKDWPNLDQQRKTDWANLDCNLAPWTKIGPISTILIANFAKKPTGAKTDWANLDRNLAPWTKIGPISTIMIPNFAKKPQYQQ